MTSKTLNSPADTITEIAKMFQESPSCTVSTREDPAFRTAEFLSLGEIQLFPQGDSLEHYAQAVRWGEFEWRTPDHSEVTDEIHVSLGVKDLKKDAQSRAKDKIRRIVDLFGAIPVRLGLSHPIFDPHTLEVMPFRRPTTIVSDTSGVLQGGLSFVSKYLHPVARVKIPAVVQMEIVNFADRFLSNRRAATVKPVDLLMDHLNSQAGQRVLLQLELHSDVELERTFLFGDPLRGAFQREEDKELKELNISVSIRSYADRLILEASRQHQSQASFGHPVMLLTSDQGLARMAMAEGMHPLYFRTAKAKAFFDKCFTGTHFHPFSGEIRTTSIPEVLWELATIFGSARLATEDKKSLSVHAIGKDLAWTPYHSHDDLLWVEFPGSRTPPRRSATVAPSPSADDLSILEISSGDRSHAAAQRQRLSEGGDTKHKPFPYRFSLAQLVTLIDRLDTVQQLSINSVMTLLGARTASGIKDYRRFLESGGAITVDEENWTAAPHLKLTAIAIRNLDICALREALRAFPSYAELEQMLSEQPVGEAFEVTTDERTKSTFETLAEITEIGASVYKSGFFRDSE